MVTKGIVYYTDNRCEERLMNVCRNQISKVFGGPIVSVSQYPINFGYNVVVDFPRETKSIFKQILVGLKNIDTEFVFLCEHDLLYSASHFEYESTKKDVFWYNRNRWSLCDKTGKALFYHTNVPSALYASRELLISHYQKVVDFIEANGWRSRYGYSPPKGLPKELRIGRYKCWLSEQPIIDIRRDDAFTRKRMNKKQFRSERSCRGWTESDEVPYWGKTKGRFDDFIKEVSRL